MAPNIDERRRSVKQRVAIHVLECGLALMAHEQLCGYDEKQKKKKDSSTLELWDAFSRWRTQQ